MNTRRSQRTAAGEDDGNVVAHLKAKLAITQRTAVLLSQLGIQNYAELQNMTPAELVASVGSLPGVSSAQAETYRRGFRRMVWLATLEEPELAAARFPDWTRKALVDKGLWEEKYDERTGIEVAEQMKEFW